MGLRWEEERDGVRDEKEFSMWRRKYRTEASARLLKRRIEKLKSCLPSSPSSFSTASFRTNPGQLFDVKVFMDDGDLFGATRCEPRSPLKGSGWRSGTI